MSGRPVRLLAAAALAAAASVATMSAASANCFSGCGYATYSAPVVYSYSYAAPVSYAAPCNPCGGGGLLGSLGFGAGLGYGAGCATGCGYASYGYTRPMYVVNQGPSYSEPVIGEPEPEVVYAPRYRSEPYYGEGGYRWRHRHWHRGYGYGYRGLRYGYRDYGYRARFGYRSAWRARHMVGPGGIWRSGMHRMHGPRIGMPYNPGMMNRHMRHMTPGFVNPMGPRRHHP